MTDKMKDFETGATRSNAEDRPDYRGYVSPHAIEMFGRYMLRHQTQADGRKRSSDNWKKGMPLHRYIESKLRHDVEFWKAWDAYLAGARDKVTVDLIEEHVSAIYFNVQGFMHEWEKAKVRAEDPAAPGEPGHLPHPHRRSS